MYIYRVVPNSAVSHVTSNIALTDRAFVGAEDIYYNLGYTSFIKEKNCKNKNWNSTINTLNTSGSGKYFFLFPEDAIIHSHDIINSFGQKRGCTFSLLVYDVLKQYWVWDLWRRWRPETSRDFYKYRQVW